MEPTAIEDLHQLFQKKLPILKKPLAKRKSLNSSQSTLVNDPPKRKACAGCYKSHVSCDGQRPCQRCISKKITCLEQLKKSKLPKRPAAVKILPAPSASLPPPWQSGYSSQISVTCSSSTTDPKCQNCQSNSLKIQKDALQDLWTIDHFSNLLNDSFELPDCFSFIDSFLENQPLSPLWMRSLAILPQDHPTLVQSDARITSLLTTCPQKPGLPTLETVIMEYAHAFKMLASPAALWTMPHGFLRLSNGSFTALSQSEMIQSCLSPTSLVEFYSALETCCQSGSASGKTVFVNGQRAALTLTLKWTTEGAVIASYFILLENL